MACDFNSLQTADGGLVLTHILYPEYFNGPAQEGYNAPRAKANLRVADVRNAVAALVGKALDRYQQNRIGTLHSLLDGAQDASRPENKRRLIYTVAEWRC